MERYNSGAPLFNRFRMLITLTHKLIWKIAQLYSEKFTISLLAFTKCALSHQSKNHVEKKPKIIQNHSTCYKLVVGNANSNSWKWMHVFASMFVAGTRWKNLILFGLTLLLSSHINRRIPFENEYFILVIFHGRHGFSIN